MMKPNGRFLPEGGQACFATGSTASRKRPPWKTSSRGFQYYRVKFLGNTAMLKNDSRQKMPVLIFNELKRRNVIRLATGSVVVSRFHQREI
jgi:hypothetical protein